MTRVDFDPQALEELEDAAAWYEAERHGLGAEFLAEVARVVDDIASRPASFARLRDVPRELDIRRARLARFPFALVFVTLDAERTRIVGVAHDKRRPGYWLARVER